MDAETPELLLSRLSDFVAHKMGWDYPPSRHSDLRRGIAAAAKDLGFTSAAECAHLCLCGALTQPQLDRLATHLTVGETYFFRESKAFENLTAHILPRLAQSRPTRELRIWSAGCCTGEEPYSIAILLREILPDWRQWKINILATDINQRFLRKAEAGVFGEWSFRGAPPWLKSRYFRAAPEGRLKILPEIADSVRFAQLNLAADDYIPLSSAFGPPDVIFCRNVLMYFTPLQARKVIEKLHACHADRGWLLVGASELSHTFFAPYHPINLDGAFLYQKDISRPAESACEIISGRCDPSHIAPIPTRAPVELPTPPDPAPRDPSETLEPPEPEPFPESIALSAEARSLANQGNLPAALSCCDRWIAADKLNPAGYYLRSVVLQEQGELPDAVQSLQRALYLDPRHILAHFALGNLARARNQPVESRKHLASALRLLKTCSPNAILPESEGVTAGRLAEIIGSLTELEATA